MKEFKLLFDTKKIAPEQIGIILRELESIATVKDGNIFFDENNQEQSQKIREILDKYSF